jgi:hypothetical protein
MFSGLRPSFRIYTSVQASGVVGLGRFGMARLGWFIVLLAGSITAGAQSGDRTPVVAPKQEIAGKAQAIAKGRLPRVGDAWTYALTLHRRDREPVQAKVFIRVTASSPNEIVDEVSYIHPYRGSPPTESKHSAGNYMVEQVVSLFSPYLVVFENLNPGDRIWRVTQNDDLCFGWLHCWGWGRVEGRETLELAAGSFDTIKVTIDQNVHVRGSSQHMSGFTTRTLTIWYSPQAKRAIKVTSRVSGRVSRPFLGTYDLELVSYQLQ